MAVSCCVWALVFVVLLRTSNCHPIPPLRFDLSRTPVEEISVRAHHNQTLSCPGANEFTLMTQLEWYSTSRRKAVLEYSQNSMTIYADQRRLSLAKDYSLIFHPILASDTGDYVCIINNRLQPDAVIRVKVLGMIPIYYTQGSKEDTWDKFGSLRTSHYGSIISGFLLYVDENLFMPFDDEDDEDDEM